jgi:PDDEXK-like domain of unknown function (DUF3799)
MLSIGLHDNIPHAIYHADPSERPSLSSHLAGILLARSPAHARLAHPRFGGAMEENPTDEMNTGSIIHGVLLGGGPEIVELDFKDFRKDAAKDARDTAYREGKIPMLAHKLAATQATIEEIRKVLPLDFAQARCEVTAIWESDGCPCRARLDSLFEKDGGWLIVDLKTCENANLSSEARNVFSFGYHRQAAANIGAVETLIPESAGRVKFVDLFVETAPPYGVVMAELAGDFRDLGQRQWKRAKGLWAQCLATDTFPSYPLAKTVEAPAWAMSEEMERSIMAAGTLPF